ncbi:MAG: hypothetical protein JXA81_07565 [Sedimentisphaerales bacterium]|nr:hypothetical protein [Sedimentisphaerales bacterium]
MSFRADGNIHIKTLLKSKRRGSAISPALVATMILIVIGVGLLSLGLNSLIYSIRTGSNTVARCVADVGLTVALFEQISRTDSYV